MPNSLTVLVTGAAGAIGGALCLRFGRGGYRVAVLDLNPEAVERTIASLTRDGIAAAGFAGDVTKLEDCETTIAGIIRQFGTVDVVIANAGITHIAEFADTDVAIMRKIMDVNFFGAVNIVKAALPALKVSKGRIVAVSSVSGFSPLLQRSAYAASKHALHGLFDTLRAELRPHGVGVTIVCPSFTGGGVKATASDGSGKWTTAGEISTPEQVAEAVYHGVKAGKRLVLPSRTARLAWCFSRLAPGWYERTMEKRIRRAG